MSAGSKKDRLIEEAQKHVLKGQFDKAVKLYEQAMSLEPSSINLRQKLAELMIKAGRVDDARKEFETIGKYFSSNGFYLKAIAVYKQLQKLFPSDLSISLTLAELNDKHGLTANALAEYKLVCDAYEKEGNGKEYLKVLDIMQNVDPGNIPIKIKLAEAYCLNSRKDEAYALFIRSAIMLQERGDNSTLSRLLTRVLQLFPENREFMLEVITEQVTNGNAASAINGLQNLLRSNPDDKRVWDLTIEAYRRIQQPQKVKLAYQHYLKHFPNDPVPMLGLISCTAAEGGPLTAAIELLDRHEPAITSAGLVEELWQVYQTLTSIDPVNIRLLEGMIKLARISNREGEDLSLSSKLQSLSSFSGTVTSHPADEPATAFKEESSGFSFEEPIESFSAEDQTLPDFTAEAETEATVEPEPAAFIVPEQAEQPLQPELSDDLEIEIELDFDESPEEPHDLEGFAEESEDDNWLDSVGGLFDSISTSPRGVRFSDEMDTADTQSHFDLGLAFREMGLYDEAINEFRQAAQDTSRRLACLTMQGACLRDRGEYDTAINLLGSLLKPGLSLEDTSLVKYELALTHESSGDAAKAAQLLNEIVAANPGFRDVTSRLNAATLENSLDFSDEELKNF